TKTPWAAITPARWRAASTGSPPTAPIDFPHATAAPHFPIRSAFRFFAFPSYQPKLFEIWASRRSALPLDFGRGERREPLNI
ncbi:MAG: hypothetical protein ABSG04_06895, partial [Verrucomicrobiota bacterium]